jgi:hypothetical protein
MAEYLPVVSTGVNLINIFQKCVIMPCMNKRTIGRSPYYRHLRDKSLMQCAILLVPVVGNIGACQRNQEKQPVPEKRSKLPKKEPVQKLKKEPPKTEEWQSPLDTSAIGEEYLPYPTTHPYSPFPTESAYGGGNGGFPMHLTCYSWRPSTDSGQCPSFTHPFGMGWQCPADYSDEKKN